MIERSLDLFREMMRKDPSPSVREVGEDAVRLSLEELSQLRAEVLALKQELHKETCRHADAELAWIASQRELADTKVTLAREQQVLKEWAEQAVTARASEQRLRERVKAAIAEAKEADRTHRYGNDGGEYLTPFMAAIEQALADDPPGQEGEGNG